MTEKPDLCCSRSPNKKTGKSRKRLAGQQLTRFSEAVSVRNWSMGRSIADPNPYSRWTDAVYAALDLDDHKRVRQLGWLCANLIDLKRDLPNDQWEQLHTIVSRGAGVLPFIVVAPRTKLPLTTWLMERLAAELLSQSRHDPLPPLPGGPIA